MAATRTETTHGLTYSVARAIEVNAWQSVDVVWLFAWLTVPVAWLRSLLAAAMGATSSVCQKRWLSSVHAISTWPTACAEPACVHHALVRPDSQLLCCNTCVLFVWYSVAWVSITFRYQSYACNWSISARVLAQAHPTKSCIHLIYECFPVTSKVNRYWSCLLCCVNSSSGNCTPGSRSYSDLLDTSVCIHQLMLKRCSSARLLA